MNNLQIFKNQEFGEIQIVEENGKIEFGATEVAKMLKYANPHKAIIDHCKKDGLTKREVIDNLGRKQEKNFNWIVVILMVLDFALLVLIVVTILDKDRLVDEVDRLMELEERKRRRKSKS